MSGLEGRLKPLEAAQDAEQTEGLCPACGRPTDLANIEYRMIWPEDGDEYKRPDPHDPRLKPCKRCGVAELYVMRWPEDDWRPVHEV